MPLKYRLIIYTGLIAFAWLSQLLNKDADIIEPIGWSAFILLVGLVVEIIFKAKGVK